MIKFNKVYIRAVIICLGLSLISLQTTASPDKPKVYSAIGNITYVDLVNNTAKIGNMTYRIGSDTTAYDKKGKKISLRRLIKGTRVGLDLSRSDGNQLYIKTFWIVGKNAIGLPNEG